MLNRNGRHAAGADDATLLRRARGRDADAFLALLMPLDERMRRLAFRILGDRDKMDDALQEAYSRAFASLDRFAGRSTFATWLYRIVYTASIDELRAIRSEEVSLGGVELGAAAGQAEPDPHVGLDQALAMLPVELRTLVLLIDAYGLTYDEAASVVEVPVGTVASRLSRARKSLRRCLQEVETQ